MPVNIPDTFEACQRRISELVALATQGGDATVDAVLITKELAQIYIKMGDMLLAGNDLENAAVCYATVLQLDPTLSETNKWLYKYKTFLEAVLLRNPNDAAVLNLLGDTAHMLKEYDYALDCFQRALEINHADATSLMGIAKVQHDIGKRVEAEENYIRASKLQPLMHSAADKTPPDFSLLVLTTPLHGGSPMKYLLEKAPYEINACLLFSNMEYDIGLLRKSGKMVLNLSTEADMAAALLPLQKAK